tara:strand:- start:814 stop:1044 length:231 start_codon:yes stop_codon:yes gene_type:complete
MKFLKDILMEDLKDKKYSSKKVTGMIGSLLAFIAFVVDGFHFYAINGAMFDSLLIFSATMLGVSTLRRFAPGQQKK